MNCWPAPDLVLDGSDNFEESRYLVSEAASSSRYSSRVGRHSWIRQSSFLGRPGSVQPYPHAPAEACPRAVPRGSWETMAGVVGATMAMEKL